MWCRRCVLRLVRRRSLHRIVVVRRLRLRVRGVSAAEVDWRSLSTGARQKPADARWLLVRRPGRRRLRDGLPATSLGDVSQLADAILPLIRTRADVWRWNIANAHGEQMHDAVDILEAAISTADPAEVYAVTHKALTSAITIIARADDSSGIIGNACRRLLELHPRTAAAAAVPPGRLITWMMKFQFEGVVDYFELDPVAYAPALGEKGMATYRAKLDEVTSRLDPVPEDADIWSQPNRHERFVLEWNAQRLAVLDQDVDAIIRTHARDRKVAAWFEDTAEALEEIGQIDLAIDWAKQAADFDDGHQSLKAADYWCRLLEEHGPAEAVEARREVFRRWPSATTAARLHKAAGDAFGSYRDEILDALAPSPRDAVQFALMTLKDPELAWILAHNLALKDGQTWSDLVKAYEKVDPLAVLPVHRQLVEDELVLTDAKYYRRAARRLVKMRKLATGSEESTGIDRFIADLRETYRRRPRLQQEFDRAGLP